MPTLTFGLFLCISNKFNNFQFTEDIKGAPSLSPSGFRLNLKDNAAKYFLMCCHFRWFFLYAQNRSLQGVTAHMGTIGLHRVKAMSLLLYLAVVSAFCYFGPFGKQNGFIYS